MKLFISLKKITGRIRQKIANREISDMYRTSEYITISSYEDNTNLDDEEKTVRIKKLTPDEYQLYKLLLEGYTYKEAEEILPDKYFRADIKTADVYKKLGVKNRAELIIGYHNVMI